MKATPVASYTSSTSYTTWTVPAGITKKVKNITKSFGDIDGNR
jgi:hypothetical protein